MNDFGSDQAPRPAADRHRPATWSREERPASRAHRAGAELRPGRFPAGSAPRSHDLARRAGLGLRRSSALALMVLLASAVVSCGDSSSVEPDPAVDAFVGTWDAVEFVVVNDADPDEEAIITDGGSFVLTVEPSGSYTAILEIQDAPEAQVEQGRLDVSGSTIILDPDVGPSATATFTFEGSDRVVLEGPTDFDFNFDGEAEPAELRIVLERR